jgi:hypothetical protein
MPETSLQEAGKISVLARARQDLQHILAAPAGTFEIAGLEDMETKQALRRLEVLVDRLARLRALSHRFHSVEVSPYVKMAIEANCDCAAAKVT